MSNPTNNTHLPDNGLKIIQVQHGDRSLAIALPDSFDVLYFKVCACFAIPSYYEVKLSVDAEYGEQIKPVLITNDRWPWLRDQVRIIRLTMNLYPRFPADGKDTIYVKTLAGNTIHIHNVNLLTDTTLNLKAAIEDKERIPTAQQRLIFDGKELENDQELRWYNVQHGSTMYLALTLRGGWGLISLFHGQRGMHDPPPRAEPLDPSKFIKENFLCVHYKHRTILTSWNADFTAFKENAVNLLEAETGRKFYFFIELAIFENKKLEVDPGTWQRMAGLISDVWVSEDVPYRETQDPAASDPGPVQLNTETTASTRQQTDSTTGGTTDPLVFHKRPAQSTPNSVRVPPNSNQATGIVERVTGSGPNPTLMPVTSKIVSVHPAGSSNLDVEPSNSAGVTSKRSIGERLRDKWRRMVSWIQNWVYPSSWLI